MQEYVIRISRELRTIGQYPPTPELSLSAVKLHASALDNAFSCNSCYMLELYYVDHTLKRPTLNHTSYLFNSVQKCKLG